MLQRDLEQAPGVRPAHQGGSVLYENLRRN
jgi:hypothetical protein